VLAVTVNIKTANYSLLESGPIHFFLRHVR